MTLSSCCAEVVKAAGAVWLQELAAKCTALEAELRGCKRREEKLQAMQFRLREDVKVAGADLRCECLCKAWQNCGQCSVCKLLLRRILGALMTPGVLAVVLQCL